MSHFILFTVTNDDGDETEHRLPARWHICGTCDGNGSHSLALGAITQEDREQWDPDEWDCYMSGGYDSTCDACNGSGKVKEVDEKTCDPKLLALYQQNEDDDAEYAHVCAMERRMGA